MATKNLFGDLLKKENMYQASTIVEEMGAKVPQRNPFLCTSPTMSWGSAVGYMPGMMELLYGPKSSGKTMIVLDRIKAALAEDPHSIAVLVDAEMNFEYESTIRWMQCNGVDISRVLIIREVCIIKIFEQKIFNELQLAIKNEGVKVAYIAMDSVQAMSPKNIPTTDAQIKKATAPSQKSGYTNQDYGARANYLSRVFPFYRMFCRDYRIFTTFIGQARDGGKDFHGNQIWVTNGGEALYHEVQYRTLVFPGKEVILSNELDANGKQVKIGHRVNFVFEKNKAGEGLGRKGYCDIVYMKGIVNAEYELTALASKLGIITQGGAWFTYEKTKENGIEKFAAALREEPDLYQEIFSKIMQRASTQFDPAHSFNAPEVDEKAIGEVEKVEVDE